MYFCCYYVTMMMMMFYYFPTRGSEKKIKREKKEPSDIMKFNTNYHKNAWDVVIHNWIVFQINFLGLGKYNH